MTVYVESNFALEQSLQQEECDSCDQIQQLADSGAISLVIPAFSLAEPHQALALKVKARNRLSSELQAHILELARSRPYRGVQDDFAAITSVLTRSAEQERDRFQSVVAGLLATAEIVPLDAGILIAAGDLQTRSALSGQDAIVLASVLQHLRRVKPELSCFLSRNSKDFDDPDVIEQLGHFNCKFVARFDAGLRYVQSHIRDSGDYRAPS